MNTCDIFQVMKHDISGGVGKKHILRNKIILTQLEKVLSVINSTVYFACRVLDKAPTDTVIVSKPETVLYPTSFHSFTNTPPSTKNHPPKKYVINLDLPPIDRRTQVIKDHAEFLKDMNSVVK